MDKEEQETTSPCTCHISNLKCKNERCEILKATRKVFKNEVCKLLHAIMRPLQMQGYTRKECVRALRRELNHKNQIQYDMFDEMADTIWGEKTK